jgi:hypothetical protein
VINWKGECEELLRDPSLNFPTTKKSSFTVHHFDETFSAEWPAVIGIVEFSRRMFSKENSILCVPGNVLSNSEDMMDQLLSKIYITASRARVYCCLILIVRDFDIYHETKRCQYLSHSEATNPETRSRLASDSVKKTLDKARGEFLKLFQTLCSHMIIQGHYICTTETDKRMRTA